VSNEMKRRQFLKESAMGVSALAVGLGGESQAASVAEGARMNPSGSSEEKVGRPVRVVSIGFEGGSAPWSGSPLRWTGKARRGRMSSRCRRHFEAKTELPRNHWMVRR